MQVQLVHMPIGLRQAPYRHQGEALHVIRTTHLVEEGQVLVQAALDLACFKLTTDHHPGVEASEQVDVLQVAAFVLVVLRFHLHQVERCRKQKAGPGRGKAQAAQAMH